jgi:pimeloyl-ACP methyl ester carboxylesterase
MLMLRSPEAEQILSANHYEFLYGAVLNENMKRGYVTQEDCDAYLEAWSQPGALRGGLNYYRAAQIGPASTESGSVERNFVAEVAELTVKVPTLVIWGEKDSYLLSGNLQGLEEFVPDLTIKRVSDGTHWVVHEKPALISHLIREFLRK